MKYLTTAYRPAGIIGEMDRVFNRLYGSAPAAVHKGFAVDIAENNDGYMISADLPGFEAAEVDVRVEDNLLIMETRVPEKGAEEKESELAWHVRERRKGALKRSFVLPEDVEKTGVEAEMKNGVLSVLLKKKPEAKPFTVEVRGK